MKEFNVERETKRIIEFIRNYYKEHNLGGVILGISGGKDSGVVAGLFVEALGKENVICLDFPIGINNQDFSSWCKTLDKYKNKITEDSIFIGRSIAPIFIIKYLLNNNLKINSLYSISGFKKLTTGNKDYDTVNKTFFMDDISNFKNNCKKIVCILSKNDPYVPYSTLEEFAKELNAEIHLIENGGHFNNESGYDKFEYLLNLLA